MTDNVDKVISDHKVASAERDKRINNEMLMLGQCDSDSHTPLLVYVRKNDDTMIATRSYQNPR